MVTSDFDVRTVNLSKMMDVREAMTNVLAHTHTHQAEWDKDIFLLLPLPQTRCTEGYNETERALLKCDHLVIEKKRCRRHKSKNTFVVYRQCYDLSLPHQETEETFSVFPGQFSRVSSLPLKRRKKLPKE